MAITATCDAAGKSLLHAWSCHLDGLAGLPTDRLRTSSARPSWAALLCGKLHPLSLGHIVSADKVKRDNSHAQDEPGHGEGDMVTCCCSEFDAPMQQSSQAKSLVD